MAHCSLSIPEWNRCARSPVTPAPLRDLARLRSDAVAAPISHAYVTAQRDERSVQTALKLRNFLEPAVRVLAALWRAYGVAPSAGTFHHTPRRQSLTVFKTLQETCSVELVEGGSFEAVAHGDFPFAATA